MCCMCKHVSTCVALEQFVCLYMYIPKAGGAARGSRRSLRIVRGDFSGMGEELSFVEDSVEVLWRFVESGKQKTVQK